MGRGPTGPEGFPLGLADPGLMRRMNSFVINCICLVKSIAVKKKVSHFHSPVGASGYSWRVTQLLRKLEVFHLHLGALDSGKGHSLKQGFLSE